MGLGACASRLIQHTPEAQTLKNHKPEDQSDHELDQSAATGLSVPWIYLSCSKTLSSWCDTPTAFTRYLLKHCIPDLKHQSESMCVLPSKSYGLLSQWKKKNPYQGLFPNVLRRFLFRGYERKPWQAVLFHEVSQQGIPSREWDL